jgi:hypothetical protein
MMRRGLLVLQCAALALTLASAHAQDRQNGFYLTSPLSLSSGYDQGFIVGSSALNDSVTILTAPTFDWVQSTHRTDFSIDYEPEFDFFARNPRLDAWDHLSRLHYGYRINSRWSIEAGNLFLSTTDSSRALANSLLLLPLGRFLQNATYAGLNYRLNQRTKISFRFDNALTITDLQGALAGRLDGVTTAGTVTVDRILTSHHKLSGSYSILHSHPFNPGISGNATNVQLVNLGYTYDINPDLIVRLAGGLVKGTETSFIGAAAVEKRLGGMWLAGGYQRYLSFFGGLAPLGNALPGSTSFANGVTPDDIYQVASVRAWGDLSKRLRLEGTAQRALNGVSSGPGSLRSAIVQGRLTYKLNDRFSVFALAEHYGQNANSFLDIPMRRNRYFAGVEIWVSRPPESTSARNHHSKLPEESDELKAPAPEDKQ